MNILNTSSAVLIVDAECVKDTVCVLALSL